jgi:hypothetical protein
VYWLIFSNGSYNPSQISAFFYHFVYMMTLITSRTCWFREALLNWLIIRVDLSTQHNRFVEQVVTEDTFNISTLASFVAAGQR